MLREGISAKKVEDRLSRNLSLEGMDRKIQEIVMQDSRGCVKKDTLIVIDPTDVCKENARKMQYLYKVRDGSRSRENGDPLLVNGYTGCMAIACNSGNRRIIPLHFSLWSTIAPDYHSENTELGRILDQIRSVHGKNGISPSAICYGTTNNKPLQQRGRPSSSPLFARFAEIRVPPPLGLRDHIAI